MRIGLLLLLSIFIPLSFPTISHVQLDDKDIRGEFHDETRLIVDYEDSSHNLTDYMSRRTSDDDKTNPDEQEVEDDESGASSDISEERIRDSIDTETLSAVKIVKQNKTRPVTVINRAFNDRKSFSCPTSKDLLVTGTSIADISPEDITIIAAMGDALATGIGLWPNAEIEFRGASFPIGGDSTIDGLVTIPNILTEFSPSLVGVSHGMGSKLPDGQLNVASTGAYTSDMLRQAKELIRRLGKLTEKNFMNEWVMIIITIGTEEMCQTCGEPDAEKIIDAIKLLQIKIPKALVILLGPIHVSSFHEQKANLLKSRCPCFEEEPESFMYDVSRKWVKAWKRVQSFVENGETARPTFGMISFPMITITSRYPNGLFIRDKPLLNRRGHNYATKWLWNRLIGGDSYNLSSAILSQDNYFCPSNYCPFFRTYANQDCITISHREAKRANLKLDSKGKLVKQPRRSQEELYKVAIVIFSLAILCVCIFGTIFFQLSKKDDHGRFEIVDESQKKLEEAQKEEQKALLTRQNTRAQSELGLNTIPLQPMVGRHRSFRGTIEEEEVPV